MIFLVGLLQRVYGLSNLGEYTFEVIMIIPFAIGSLTVYIYVNTALNNLGLV